MQERLSENKRKPKELWKIIKNLGLLDKKTSTINMCFNTEKELTFSPSTIANNFKKHFANSEGDLVKKFPGTTEKFEKLSVC